MENKYTDIMLDVETLGNEGQFVVLQVAMVPFNIDSGEISNDSLNITINVKEQLEKGFKVSDNTVEWWLKTNVELLSNLIKSENSIYTCCNIIRNYINEIKPKRFWATATLDYQAISNLFNSINKDNPITYNKRFCGRTIRMLAELNGYEHESKNNHDALDDCVFQIDNLLEQLGYIEKDGKFNEIS